MGAFSFKGSENTKDVSNLYPGVYILRYHSGDKMFRSIKLVKL